MARSGAKGATYTASAVRFSLCARECGLDAILGAAYSLAAEADVVLSGSGQPMENIKLRLRPRRVASRRGLEGLAAAFEAELARRQAVTAVKPETAPRS